MLTARASKLELHTGQDQDKVLFLRKSNHKKNHFLMVRFTRLSRLKVLVTIAHNVQQFEKFPKKTQAEVEPLSCY